MDRGGIAQGRLPGNLRAGTDSGSRRQGTHLSKQTYHPDRGDIVHLNLAPSAGQELTGPHFALVISTARFSKATGFAIMVPGTTKYHAEQRMAGQQLMLKLPPVSRLTAEGWLYPHQIKSLDYRDRGVTFVTKLENDDFLIDVMERMPHLSIQTRRPEALWRTGAFLSGAAANSPRQSRSPRTRAPARTTR